MQQRLQGELHLEAEAVQLRQPGRSPSRRRETRRRSTACSCRSPPNRFSSSDPTAFLERARAEEEQRLKTPWLSVCSRAAPSANAAPLIGALRPQEQAGAGAREHDDPHVLDRMQREQPLEVVLEEGVDDAADGRQLDAEHERCRNHVGRIPTHSTSTRTRPQIATLIITPLISADTGAGAIGCARGSQTWSGITPAFVPIPNERRQRDRRLQPGAGLDRGGVAHGFAWASSRIAIHVPAPPR